MWGWKRCECPIFVSGTLARKFRRQATGQWEWDRAREVAAKWEAAGKWGSDDPPAPPILITEATVECPTVSDAIEAFLAKCKVRNWCLLFQKIREPGTFDVRGSSAFPSLW
jgi:hypothetical protein